MANYLDIQGKDYESDFANIQQMFKDLTETINTSNLEGQIITHQFVGTTAETIDHELAPKVPTKVLSVLQEGATASFEFTGATATTVTLKSSDAALKLTFYLE